MKHWSIALLGLILLSCTSGYARQSPGTQYLQLRIESYDVSARISLVDRKVVMDTTVSITNPTDRAVSQLEFKLGEKVQLRSVTVNGATVTPSSRVNERTATLNVGFDTPQSIAPGQTAKVNFQYDLPVEESSARSALTMDEQYLLPEAFWVPMIHTPYLIEHNVDLAPYTLRITAPGGMKPISSGELVSEKAEGDSVTTTYRQTMLARPVFIARDLQLAGGDTDIEVYLPRDYALTNTNTVERIRAEVGKTLTFYSEFFGRTAPGIVRLAASSQVPFYGAPGILVLDERSFARDVIDEDTVFFIASSLARMWLSGRQQIQGAGNSVLYDGLPGYLALLYLEDQYSRAVVDRMIDRFRNQYSRIVTGGSVFDAPLSRQSMLNREYYTSLYNKVPIVLRLIEKTVGREKFLDVIKKTFSGPAGQPVTLNDLRAALLAAGPAETLGPVLDQWIDQVILPDFAVGKPVLEQGQWSVTVANFGDGGGAVDVEVVTGSGERFRKQVKVEAEGYGQARFDLPSEPVSALVDPDRLYVQARYDNDVFPRLQPIDQLIGQGTMALIQGKAAEAEPKLREAVTNDPSNLVGHAVLARALASLGRLTEAEREVEVVMKEQLPSLAAYANAQWARGEIMLKRQQPAQAVGPILQTTLSMTEDASLLTAREALIQAERAADQLPRPDESVTQFIAQFDAAVSTGRPGAVRDLVEPANLKAFTVGVSFIKGWKTDILRAQRLDAQRVTLDVQTQATTERVRSVRSIYTLRKQGGAWKLYDIPVFIEK